MKECITATLRGRKFKKILEQRFEKIRKKYELKQVDLDIIYYLSQSDAVVNASEICRNLDLNKGQVSTSLDRLEKEGFVESKQCDEDKRQRFYRCTKKAGKPVKDLNEETTRIKERIIEGIPEEALAGLVPILEKLYENMDKMIIEMESEE